MPTLRRTAAQRAARLAKGAFPTGVCDVCGWSDSKPTAIGAKVALGFHRRTEHGIHGRSSQIRVRRSGLRRGPGDNFDSTGLLERIALGKRRAA